MVTVLIVGLIILIHSAHLLRVICLFSVFDNSFKRKIRVIFISDILDKYIYDCIWVPILPIKSECSSFGRFTCHKVSLQYVINCFWIVHARAYARV